MIRYLTTLAFVLAFHFTALAPLTAAAGNLKQTTAGSPPEAIQPQPTKGMHEIGFGLHFNDDPDVFLPRPRYRYLFSSTGRQGMLSGLWLEAGIGPGIGYGGGVLGNIALTVGYEFDPFSNLALTFAPTIHNDVNFTGTFFGFTQTYGMVARLYVKAHWVVYLEPISFGWFIGRSGGNTLRARFAHQTGFGFGYRF